MCTLAYFAVDNYIGRIKLENQARESAALHLKLLKLQQEAYTAQIRQANLTFVEELRKQAVRNFRMALHIAMLRRQLTEKSCELVSIEDAKAEYEKTVRSSRQPLNVTGDALWMEDGSPYAPYFTDFREYDDKRT